MSFFTKEDNKNLYESNLSEFLKNYIANFNEIIILFLKEKFKNEEGLDKFLETIREKYKTTGYTIDNNMNSNASFFHNANETQFKINEKTLDIYSIEKGLIGIYFHEFSHFISYTFQTDRTTRIEEGIADLLSDELVDYFNNIFAEDELIEKKQSVYKEPASIVRSTCLINNNNKDLLWNYYSDNKDEIKRIFETAYGKENAQYILDTEKYTNNTYYISKKEQEIISNKLKETKLESIDSNYIRLNKLLQEEICRRIENNEIELDQIKEYKNIPEEFYNDYKILFEDINLEKTRIINSNNLNENIKELVSKTIKDMNLEKIKNPNNKIGIYNDYTIDVMLEYLKYKKIFNLDPFYLVAYLYSYKLRYNNENYNEDNLFKTLSSLGFNSGLEYNTFIKINETTKDIYNNFKTKDIEECFNDVEDMFKKQIKNSIEIEYYTNKLNNNEITLDDYSNKMIEKYKEESIFEYKPIIFINSLIEEYVKNIKEDLNIESFEKAKQEIESKLNGLDIENISDINALIITNWNIEKVKVYDVIEILGKYKIDTTIPNEKFEDIRIKGIIDIENENDFNNILRYINSVSNDNYLESYPYIFTKRNGRNYDTPRSLEIQKEKVKNILEKEENNSITKELIEKEDRNYIYFYRYNTLKPLKKEDIEILKKITGKDIDSTDFSKYIKLFRYDEDIYNKLKEYPHLAATYIQNFMPYKAKQITSISMLESNLIDLSKYNNAFLKSEYENELIREIDMLDVEKIIQNDFEIRNYSDMSNELFILKSEPYSFLNKDKNNEFLNKTLEIMNRKIEEVFINNRDTYQDKNELKETIIKNIKEIEEQIKNEKTKQSLNEVLEKINQIEIRRKGDNYGSK